MRKPLYVLCISLFATSVQAQTVRYVHDGGDAENGCTSWEDACPELQTALSLAEAGDHIWVAIGTYKPDYDVESGQHSGDRSASFQLINGVSIFGGFDGTETVFADRSELFNMTILTGDLDDDDEPAFLNNAENSYHVVTGGGSDETALLDGFFITAGNANGPDPNTFGGGMYNNDGSPMVTNCTFSGNYAMSWAGGMFNKFSSPTVTNCTFSGNSGDKGGGMFNFTADSNPTVTNCMFSGNTAHRGGGMYNFISSPTLIDCTFSGNSADTVGGGVFNDNSSPTITNCVFSGNSAEFEGGGMQNELNSSPIVTDCTFSGNSANSGGGMYSQIDSDPMVTNCTFVRNNAALNGGGMFNASTSATVTNCMFSGNSATIVGGAIYNSGGSPAVTDCTFSGNTAHRGGGMYNADTGTVTNCTFSGNTATDAGGGIYNTTGSPTVTNCILWSNLGDGSTDQSAQIVGGLINYSCIQNLILGGDFDNGTNIPDDPLLILMPDSGLDGRWGTADDNYGDLRLSPGSPCIDAADNTAVPADDSDLDGDGDTNESIPFDLDGSPRFVNDPYTQDTGLSEGLCPVIDIGAYEFQNGATECCPADLDGDGVVDATDLAQLLEAWGTQQGHPADFNGDGVVNASDLAVLLASWGPCP